MTFFEMRGERLEALRLKLWKGQLTADEQHQLAELLMSFELDRDE